MSATGTVKAATPAPTPEADRRLFDVHAAAEYLNSIGAVGTTVHFVRGIIGRGEIPHLKIGKKMFLSRGSLDAWLQKNERRAR